MVFAEDGTPLEKTVKAKDISMQSQDSYEYPYMGLKAVLPDELKKQMDDSDVVMITSEDWTEDMSGIKYAFLHWDKLTEEQKSILNQYANTTVNARSSTDAASSGSSIFGDHKRKKGFKKGL